MLFGLNLPKIQWFIMVYNHFPYSHAILGVYHIFRHSHSQHGPHTPSLKPGLLGRRHQTCGRWLMWLVSSNRQTGLDRSHYQPLINDFPMMMVAQPDDFPLSATRNVPLMISQLTKSHLQ
jgi:hypothetical protein